MNIQEDYVSFETTKLLKEKGFNENTEHKIWYVIKQFSTGCHWNSCTYKVGDITREYNNDYCIPMPTLQMAMKWLRLHHHLHIIVEVTWKDKIPHYQWRIEVLNTQHTIVDTPCCNKAEQACEAAIKYCLEKLI